MRPGSFLPIKTIIYISTSKEQRNIAMCYQAGAFWKRKVTLDLRKEGWDQAVLCLQYHFPTQEPLWKEAQEMAWDWESDSAVSLVLGLVAKWVRSAGWRSWHQPETSRAIRKVRQRQWSVAFWGGCGGSSQSYPLSFIFLFNVVFLRVSRFPHYIHV